MVLIVIGQAFWWPSFLVGQLFGEALICGFSRLFIHKFYTFRWLHDPKKKHTLVATSWCKQLVKTQIVATKEASPDLWTTRSPSQGGGTPAQRSFNHLSSVLFLAKRNDFVEALPVTLSAGYASTRLWLSSEASSSSSHLVFLTALPLGAASSRLLVCLFVFSAAAT